MFERLFRFNAREYVHSIRQELFGVVLFVASLWLTFVLSRVFPLNEYLGLTPRYLSGLPGIAGMPFLHENFAHIFSNTIPLLVLLTLLAGSRANSTSVVVSIVLISGALIWLLAPNGVPAAPKIYVGASSLVFGLVTFLIASGAIERRPAPLVVAFIVGLMYGGTILYELTFLRALFSQQQNISWTAHVYGAVAGLLVAYSLTHERGRRWITTNVPSLGKQLPESRV